MDDRSILLYMARQAWETIIIGYQTILVNMVCMGMESRTMISNVGLYTVETSRIPCYCSMRMLKRLQSENMGCKNCYIFAFLIRNLLNGMRS